MHTLQVFTFSPFLPQDIEEAPESEQVVLVILKGLIGLLKLRGPEFWVEVQKATSLPICLATYLQFSR